MTTANVTKVEAPFFKWKVTFMDTELYPLLCGGLARCHCTGIADVIIFVISQYYSSHFIILDDIKSSEKRYRTSQFFGLWNYDVVCARCFIEAVGMEVRYVARCILTSENSYRLQWGQDRLDQKQWDLMLEEYNEFTIRFTMELIAVLKNGSWYEINWVSKKLLKRSHSLCQHFPFEVYFFLSD